MSAYSPAVLGRAASPGLEGPLTGATLGLVPVYGYDAGGRPESVEDARGNRTTTVHDQENRQLQEIMSSGARHTYTYEPDGLRRSAFHAGPADVITFIWDGDDLLNERIEGVHAARYAVLNGEVLSEKRGASRCRLVPDPLGSVRALLDTSGSIVATRDYWPYGEVAAQSGGMTAIQFVGILGYFTDTANRICVRARHYRPDLGRWVTVDPIGFEGGDWNLYRYVRSAPTSLADASGTDCGPYEDSGNHHWRPCTGERLQRCQFLCSFSIPHGRVLYCCEVYTSRIWRDPHKPPAPDDIIGYRCSCTIVIPPPEPSPGAVGGRTRVGGQR